MASLKRDTPAGRAALARRRQRAAAVVDNSTRFVDGGLGGSQDSNSPTYHQTNAEREEAHYNQRLTAEEEHPYQHQQQSMARQYHHHHSHGDRADPPQYEHEHQQHQQLQQQEEPQRSSSSSSRMMMKQVKPSTSYSTASLPSSDELLQRSSEVAQAAASVLASARKSKLPQRSYVYNTSANNMNTTTTTNTNTNTNTRAADRYTDTTMTHSSNSVSSSGPPMQQQQQQPAQVKRDTTDDSHQHHHHTKVDTFSTGQRQPQTTSYSSNISMSSSASAAAAAAAPGGTRLTPMEQPSSSHAYRLPSEEEKERMEEKDHTSRNRQKYQDDDDDDDDTEIEEPNASGHNLTVEELEPVYVAHQNDKEVLDAACMNSGTWVMLRSMATSATVSTMDGNPLALLHGVGLGNPEELLHVVKLQSTVTAATAAAAQGEHEEEQHNPSGSELRWGDTVALLSSIHLDPQQQQPKALGIRKQNNGIYQIGWFRSTLGQAETWTMLRSSQQCVRVGVFAPRATKDLAEQWAARGEVTRVVQSGDPILLRHNQTGGLLSIDSSTGELRLLTDSYDSNNLTTTTNNNNTTTTTSLMGQLQQHDRCYPSDQETFAFVKSSVPPCPRWILGGGTSSSSSQTYNPSGHRMFLHKTYLTEPDRNQPNDNLHEKLFGKKWSSFARLHQPHSSVTLQQPMELKDQENLLLDEVIGACLGLEGQYVKVRKTENTVYSADSVEFYLQDSSHQIFDVSLRNLTQRILPMATSYARVSAFVAAHLPGYEYGSVTQAFCEALDNLLQEYATFMSQVEQQFRRPTSPNYELTLRKLYAQVLSSLHTMSILERATFVARDKTGGALINALSTLKAWSCEGDLVANKVLCILLDKASIPYMKMLTSWLQHGVLTDPYGEFMVEICDQKEGIRVQPLSQPSKHSANSNFNKESYFVREEHILTGLVSADVILQKVVATGKYWRAVRACEVAAAKKKSQPENPTRRSHRKDLDQQSMTLLRYSVDLSATTTSFIQTMYTNASQALLGLLFTDFNFLDALRTMKQYFLLDHGDFLVHFLDVAEDELLKDLGEVSSGRVQHWLRVSVQMTEDRGTNGRSDMPLEHDQQQRSLSPLALRCRFEPVSLIEHVKSLHLMRGGEGGEHVNNNTTRDESYMASPPPDSYGLSNKGLTGVETFMLDFPSVPFPISLVLTDGALGNYQLLFRLLFFAKYVERRLVKIWQDHQAMKELGSVRGLFGPTFLLRQRMLHFAQNLIYYIMFEVIEPNWMEMEEAIGNPVGDDRRTVDDIVEIHEAFLHKTLAACLLTDKDLVRTLTKLMTTCLMFADQMKLFTEATRIHDESTNIAAERRNAIQRSLNDRGVAGKGPVDKNVLREALNSFKQERQARVKKQKRRVGRELSSESYRGMVARFEEVFSAYLSEFMLQLNSDAGAMYGSHKSNLCIRLDYNGFLSSSIVIDDGRLA